MRKKAPNRKARKKNNQTKSNKTVVTNVEIKSVEKHSFGIFGDDLLYVSCHPFSIGVVSVNDVK